MQYINFPDLFDMRQSLFSVSVIVFIRTRLTSVADPMCLSRIPDLDFCPSRIPDLGSRISDLGSRIQKQQQKRGVKEFVVLPFFVATKITKLKIILILNW
jgi:hypothetical protein